MSSRIEKMLAKTQGVRAAKDIPEDEIVKSTVPKTAPGTLAAWQAAQVRIEELEAEAAAGGGAMEIPLDAISPNPWQPRRRFDPRQIESLAESIAEVDLIQPIVIRVKPGVRNSDTQASGDEPEASVRNSDTCYQLVAGERRLRAHKLLGKSYIKAIVVNVTDEDMAAMALAENIDREDLTDYEIAVAIRNAQDSFPTRKELATAIGKRRTEIYAYLAFFKLPQFAIDDLEENPTYLGRTAAEDIVKAITAHGSQAVDVLAKLWPRIKTMEVDQGKIAAMIETAISRKEAPAPLPSNREIKKLFVGKEQAGSITRDAGSFTVKIKATVLDPVKEQAIREFVEGLFKD